MKKLAILLSLMLLMPDFAAFAAEPPKPKQSDEAARGAETAQTPAAAPAPASTAPVKEPLIEVSVDSLEINETNTENLGLLFNPNGAGITTFAFEERTIPAIFTIGTLDRITSIQATLSAMIKNNQARILANPTLVTKSGFEANFLVGGEIPYPTVGQGGVSGVEFKKYGVTLKILPQVSPRKTIDAQINVGVSNIDNANSIKLQGVTVPALTARETGTKVEVADGETVVLSGIKQSRRDKTVTKVPFLGSIPLLGLLFRHKEEIIVQTSLVIFVTFRYVK